MTQPKSQNNQTSEIVKLLKANEPGNFLNALQFIISSLIEAELEHKINADHYERSESRKTYRNGYRDRKTPLKTGLGQISIRIPKIRKGSFFPSVLEKYSRIDQALISVIGNAYINGVSTRKMEKVFKKIGIEKMDKNIVSRCANELDSHVQEWKNRELDSNYAYIWLDAIYTKVRKNKRVISTAILISTGVKEDGHRDVLGFHLGNNESYNNWKDFLQQLKMRGLKRAELWITDEHDGLIKSIEECFPGQLRQRCIVHWYRNLKSKISSSEFSALKPYISNLIMSRNPEIFKKNWELFFEKAKICKNEKVFNWLEETYSEISVYIDFPTIHWPMIKSTNSLERLNEEVRRREKVIRIFPDEDSCTRLVGSILLDYSEYWTTSKPYMKSPLELILSNQNTLVP